MLLFYLRCHLHYTTFFFKIGEGFTSGFWIMTGYTLFLYIDQKLTSQVHEIVGRINGRFGSLTTVPIHHLVRCWYDDNLTYHHMYILFFLMDDDGVLGNFYEERKKIKYISRILDIVCVLDNETFS
jgi:hypothetical protein